MISPWTETQSLLVLYMTWMCRAVWRRTRSPRKGIGYAELFSRHTGGKFLLHSPQGTAESTRGSFGVRWWVLVQSGKATSVLLTPVKLVRSFPLTGTGVELYNQRWKTGTLTWMVTSRKWDGFPLGKGWCGAPIFPSWGGIPSAPGSSGFPGKARPCRRAKAAFSGGRAEVRRKLLPLHLN